MKNIPLLLSLLAFFAFPVHAQLGPAGVPGAPGLVPAPASTTPPPPAEAAKGTSSNIPAECVKAKNVDRCIARVEARKKAEAACQGKPKGKFDACVRNQMRAKKN